MKTVISDDMICTRTVALIPAREIGCDTIVMKESEAKYVRETAFNLIKLACYYYDFTTYEGRRDGVIFYTNFVQKTPMPISIQRGIYFFPTHSPHHIDNCWIALHHVLSIRKVPKHQATQKAQSIIHFKNGQSLTLNVSLHTLQEQYNRTFQCMILVEERDG